MHFFDNVLTARAALVFVAALICLVGYGYPGYQERKTGGFYWLLWLLAGMVSIFVWFKIVLA